MSHNPGQPRHEDVADLDHDEMIDANEVAEEIPEDEDDRMDEDDNDDPLDPGETLEEIQLQNDSVAHFDGHNDSIFCIAQHPIHPELIATGGGDEIGFIFDASPPERPLLPASYQTDSAAVEAQMAERESLKELFKLEGHTDSINAVTFTSPRGEYVVSAGLDGRLRVWKQTDAATRSWSFVAEAQEVEEINWLSACPHTDHPNTVALGASDGSVWVYSINATDSSSPLTIVQAFYSHTASCTAGAWTPDGKLLATVSEDSSFYVWDVFGEATAFGAVSAQSGAQSVVALTAADERFAVDGGLYSVAIVPNGTFAAVGGAEGNIRIIGLPRIGGGGGAATATATSSTGGRARSKVASGKQSAGSAGAGQAGQILASLQAQSDGIETLSFSQPPLNLLAAGSVDGSIALFDCAHRFAVRRHIKDAHDEEAVIKVDFVKSSQPHAPAGAPGIWLLTSCGNDGVVRRWDARGGTAAAGQGLVGEWRGHRGGGEGGGILGFVQGGGGAYVVTAGDDGVSLVFSTSIA